MTTEEIWIGENDVRRQLEGEELDEFLASRARAQKAKDDAEAEAQAKADAKASALAKLASLGLSAEEAALLLG